MPVGVIEAFGLVVIRTSTLVLAAPLLGTGSTFSGYRLPLIVLTSVVLFSVSDVQTIGYGVDVITFGLYALREVLIGFVLAFILQTVLLAVRVSSSMIGHEMGFTMSSIVDPSSGINTPLIAQMYEVFFFLSLLAVNGHHWILKALQESLNRAPIGRVKFEASSADVALELMGQLFAAGVTFAAPILVILALVSTLIGLLSRAVPQLNMMEFGFNLRIALGLFSMMLFAPLLQPALDGLLLQLLDGLDAGLDALGV